MRITTTDHTSSTLRGAFFMGGSMIKRFYLALAILAGLFSPAHSAGTIGLSLTQRFDAVTTKPLNGGKLYFIQAGTTSTPQNAFQDSALTIPWPNPITLDAGGNVPQLFFADGQIKIRLTNASGVNQLVADNILVVGASSGGGGGGTVDPTTILQTGDLKFRYGTGVLTGFVRQNGRTIGSATSGATERANSDAQPLFEYLWNTDPNLTVSTGRGASANADWVANKTITLPDARGRVPAGLDGMGNSAAGNLTTALCVSNTDTLGSKCGLQQQTIPQSALPPVGLSVTGNGSGTFNVNSNDLIHGTIAASSFNYGINAGSFGTLLSAGAVAFGATASGNVTITGSTTALNGGVTQTALPTVQPTILLTVYQKL